jgi:peroxiredoxin
MSRIFFALCCLPAFLFACSAKKEEKSKILVEQVNDYPAIVLTFHNGQQVSAKQMKGKNVFIFFQPDCDHCQEEAMEISQRLQEFKDYTLYFISSSSMEQMTAFAKNFNLDGRENVKFAWTSTEGVLTHYGAIQTPSIYIYSNGQLKQSFNGQTNVENILSAL